MSTPTPSTADSTGSGWLCLPPGRGDAGATAVVESLRELPQLTEVVVQLENNDLGPGLGGLCQSILRTLPHKPRPRQRGEGKAPGHLCCAAGASERHRSLIRGPAGTRPGVRSWLLWETSGLRLFRLRGLSLGALAVGFLPSAADLPPKKQRSRGGGVRAFKLVAVAVQSCFGVGLGSLLVWDL